MMMMIGSSLIHGVRYWLMTDTPTCFENGGIICWVRSRILAPIYQLQIVKYL